MEKETKRINTVASYLLDTSSIRGINHNELRRIAAKAELLVSPVTFYEFLSHKDKNNTIDSPIKIFDRYKANLSKCSLPKMLNDPYAEKVILKNCVNPNRFEEREVTQYSLYQVLQALENTTTREEFLQKKTTDPNGEKALMQDVVERSSRNLGKIENEYVRHIKNICPLLLKDYDYNQLKNFEPKQFVDNIFRQLEILTKNCNVRLGELLPSIYLHLGYELARSIKYLNKSQGRLECLNIDINDMEDSYICLHLALNQKRILVTGDTGIQKALRLALNNLRNALKVKQISIPPIYADVIYTGEFKHRFQGVNEA